MTGSFFPELLEPRRRIDKAMWAVIRTPYIAGASTRKVHDLVKKRCGDALRRPQETTPFKKGHGFLDNDTAALRSVRR